MRRPSSNSTTWFSRTLPLVQLIVAEDCLEGLADIFDPPNTVYAPQVVARTALETAARSWYLMEPEVTAKHRAGRFLNEKVTSLRHSASVTEGELSEGFRKKLRRVWEQAGRDGRKVITDRSGKPLGIEEIRPTATVLVSSLLQFGTKLESDAQRITLGEIVYRQFSAVGHGTYAGAYGNMTLIKDPSKDEPGAGNPQMTFMDISGWIATSTWGWLLAMDRSVYMAGWDIPNWHSWRDYAQLKIRQAIGPGNNQ